MDVNALDAWVKEHRTIKGFSGGTAFNGPEVITWDVNVLIPAGFEDAITEENASDLKADIIVEGANGPATPAAHEILVKRGVLIIPDILANADCGISIGYTTCW